MRLTGTSASRHSNRAKGRRWWTVIGAVALLAAVLAIPTTAISDPGDDPLAGLSLPGAEDYQQLATGQEPAPSNVEPTTEAEREASATEYEGLSDQGALELLRSEADSILKAETFPELDVPQGDEAVYPDPFTAIVGEDLPPADSADPDRASFDPADAALTPGEAGQNVMIESTIPLVAPEGGELQPLDGDLEPTAEGYAADNAAVDAELPAQLEAGIELGEAGVTVTPASTGDAAAIPTRNLAFYPSTDTDTDTLVTPTPTGVEVFFQLRSAESPEANAIDLELPAGALLAPTADGGAEVTQDGQTLVTIPPASAWDAAGNPVEVSYEISANRLTVVSPHRDQDLLYPVYVDPVIDYYPWDPGPQETRNLKFWYWHTNNGNFTGFFHESQGGVMSRATPGGYYAGAWSQWVATPIRQDYIEYVAFYNVDHTPSYPGACSWLSIWSGSYWAWGAIYNANSGALSSGYGISMCGNESNRTWAMAVGNSAYPDGDGVGDPEAADGSVGIFGLYNSYTGQRSSSAENLMRSAQIYRGDRNNPGIPALPTSSWSPAPEIPLSDAGLGVAGYGVLDPTTNTWVGGGGPGCDGSHTSVCPDFTRLSMSGLPEGAHDYQLQAFDPLYNASPRVWWTARIDRTQPSNFVLGGSLKDNAGAVSEHSIERLTMSANGGDSGMKRFDVYLDTLSGPPIFSAERPAGECNLDAAGRCPAEWSSSWDIDTSGLALGSHKVFVFAKDAAGNVNTQILDFTVAADETDPEVNLWTEPTAADGTTLLHIVANDPGPVASGVNHVEVWSDGAQLGAFDNSCGGTGCVFRLGPDQNPAVKRTSVIADDRADNSGQADEGPPNPHYEYFGYNDEWRDRWPDLERAWRGGMRTIKLTVQWCQAERDAGTFRWGLNGANVQAALDEVARINRDVAPSGEKLKVIAGVIDSPWWANGSSTGDPGDCIDGQDVTNAILPPLNDYLERWERLIREFVNEFDDDNYKIAAVEIWNEPNKPNFWRGDAYPRPNGEPGRFAQLVNHGSAAVRQASNGVKVLSGAMSPTGLTDERDYLEAATNPARDYYFGAGAVNGVGVHIYGDEETKPRKIRARELQQYAHVTNGLPGSFSDTDRWITEIGVASAPGTGRSESRQARALHAAFTVFSRARIPAFIVHSFRDVNNEGKARGVFPAEGNAPKGGRNGAYCTLAGDRDLSGSSLPEVCQ